MILAAEKVRRALGTSSPSRRGSSASRSPTSAPSSSGPSRWWAHNTSGRDENFTVSVGLRYGTNHGISATDPRRHDPPRWWPHDSAEDLGRRGTSSRFAPKARRAAPAGHRRRPSTSRAWPAPARRDPVRIMDDDGSMAPAPAPARDGARLRVKVLTSGGARACWRRIKGEARPPRPRDAAPHESTGDFRLVLYGTTVDEAPPRDREGRASPGAETCSCACTPVHDRRRHRLAALRLLGRAGAWACSASSARKGVVL